MKKSKAIIDDLPDNIREALEQWLFEDKPKLTYVEASKRLYADFNVRVGKSSVGDWWQKRARERQLEKIVTGAQDSNQVVDTLRKNQSKVFEGLLELVGQEAFAMKMRGEELDMDALKDLKEIAMAGLQAKAESRKLEQKDQQIAQQDRKIVILEKKAAQADAAKGLLENKELTEEQRSIRMRAVFGL